MGRGIGFNGAASVRLAEVQNIPSRTKLGKEMLQWAAASVRLAEVWGNEAPK